MPQLKGQPKWFNSDRDVKEGDVVLFQKSVKEFAGTYQYGMIKKVSKSRDGKIRVATVEYQNHNEDTKRYTNRRIRDLIMIHHVNELNILQELGEIATMQMLRNGCQIINLHPDS